MATDLTEMERRVLHFFELVAPGISGADGFIEQARPAFRSLIERGYVEQLFVLSEAGKAAARALAEQQKG